MRARRTTRVPTAAKLAVGASVLVFPATAVAMTSTSSHVGAQTAVALHAARPMAVRYGHRITVRGSGPVDAVGLPIELRYRAADASSWRTIARGHVHVGGRFALSARVTRSGGLQVVAAAGASGVSGLAESTPAFASDQASGWVTSTAETAVPTPTAADPAPQVAASAVRHLTVKPRLSVSDKAVDTVMAGKPTQIRGHLLPGTAGRKVVLEVEHGHRWIPAAAVRTTHGGTFDFRYVPAPTASQRFQVAFGGDRLNGRTESTPHSVIPMQYAEVSWYDDAGDTACGFHATYGIASRTLACGSKVALSFGGRRVVATVDDRGPFVYSRLYDLDQSTASALGMNGVATVLASV